MNRKRDDDLDDEIQSHIQMSIRDRVERGESESDARAAALRELGNVGLIKETTRSVWTWTSLEQLLQDVRFGVRILWKSPALSATAAILIAMVIGCNITIYSMFHSFMTKPAPEVHGGRLVTVQTTKPQLISYPNYLDSASQSRSLRPMTAFIGKLFSLSVHDGSYTIAGSVVDADYFSVMGVRMLQGSGFDSVAAKDEAVLPVVISYRIWQERFQSSASVIGKAVVVDGHPASVIGVTPQFFQGAYLSNIEDLWISTKPYYRALGDPHELDDRTTPIAAVIGVLAPNVTLSQAQAEWSAIWSRMPGGVSAQEQQPKIRLFPYVSIGSSTENVQNAGQFLSIFAVVTVLTLLLVSANVANLMLGRAVVKRRETAIRQSFGATRLRISRMLFAESLAITIAAWAGSLMFSYWTERVVARMLARTISEAGVHINAFNIDFAPDASVLGYALLLAFGCMLAFTLGPAVYASRRAPLLDLRAGEQSIARGRSPFSRALVAAQIALAVVLLAAAGFLFESISLATSGELGFSSDNLLLITVNPLLAGAKQAATVATYDAIRSKLASISGVRYVSYGRGPQPSSGPRVAVYGADSEKNHQATLNYVGPGYLETLGVRRFAGRDVSSDEGSQSQSAIINKSLADRLWPNQSAIGQILRIGLRGRTLEVVGVADDVFVNDNRNSADYILAPEQQAAAPLQNVAGIGDLTFFVRYSGDISTIGPAVRASLREADVRIPIRFMRTMDEQLALLKAPRALATTAVLVFSFGSLLVAVIGQYAVVAFEVKRRRRELGVQMAMGATTQNIVGSIVREGMLLTAVGLAAGVVISIGFGGVFRSVLYGFSVIPFSRYTEILILLLLASLIACYLPARSASRLDPLVALRHE
jgi:predicted permease